MYHPKLEGLEYTYPGKDPESRPLFPERMTYTKAVFAISKSDNLRMTFDRREIPLPTFLKTIDNYRVMDPDLTSKPPYPKEIGGPEYKEWIKEMNRKEAALESLGYEAVGGALADLRDAPFNDDDSVAMIRFLKQKFKEFLRSGN